jgi:hypothetical protein
LKFKARFCLAVYVHLADFIPGLFKF